MPLVVNPVSKLGSLHIRPNWRYDVLQNPARYKMQDFVTIPESNSGCLKRFLRAGLPYEVNRKIPDYLTPFFSSADAEQRQVLDSLVARHFKRSGQKNISIDSNSDIFINNPVWNLGLVPKITDPFLKRLILHHSNFKFDLYIQKALDMYKSPDHKDIVKFIGYCIYAKVSDKEIAKRWCMPVGQAEALRLIFYDFSHFPKDSVANFTYLRQLTNIGLFDDVDFAFFKRAFELGELGLKAQTSYYLLTPSEKKIIEEFLGKSIVTTTLNLNFAIRNQKDAVGYGTMISNLASYYIKQSEMTYFEAKTENLKACTKRIVDAGPTDTDTTTQLDKELLDLLTSYSLQDSEKIQYKSLDSLQNND